MFYVTRKHAIIGLVMKKGAFIFLFIIIAITIAFNSVATTFAASYNSSERQYIFAVAYTQGWLVPYAGQQKTYKGDPCKVRDPLAPEQKVLSDYCAAQNPSCEDDLQFIIHKWPTCESRGLTITLQNGKQVAMDKTDISQIQKRVESKNPQPKVQTNILYSLWQSFVSMIQELLQKL